MYIWIVKELQFDDEMKICIETWKTNNWGGLKTITAALESELDYYKIYLSILSKQEDI